MDKREKYMPWIREFSKSITNFFKGQMIGAMQPIDFYHFFPLWYDMWITRVATVIKKLKLDAKHFSDIKDILPPPSNFRTILKKMIVAYRGNPTCADDYKLVANFFARMLKESCPKDPFALKSNPVYSPPEVNKIIAKIQWTKANPQCARKIGQLITASGSLVHGLYNDVVTDFGWDVYGPYKVRYQNQSYTLLMRHFLHLRPTELWSKKNLPSVKEIEIFALYKEINWEINFFGCHTVSTGQSPVNAMKKCAVYANKKPLNQTKISLMIDEFSVKATKIYQKIKKMNFEQLKLLVMRQECYQLKDLFDKAGVGWQPTAEMISKIKNKPLLTGLFPQKKLIKDVEEFKKIFGIKQFAKEVLNEKI